MIASSAYSNYWFTWFPGALLATLGVLTLVWKAIEQRVEEKRVLRELKVALPVIQAEFSTNGGSSMRDAVDRLESGQRRAARRLDEHDHRFEKVDATLERIEDRL